MLFHPNRLVKNILEIKKFIKKENKEGKKIKNRG